MLVESNPANISCFPRRLQDVFAIRFPKTSSRHLQDVLKTSPRRLQDVFKTCLQDVLQLRFQDILKVKKMLHWRRLKDVFSTSSPRQMFAGTFSGVNQWNEGGRWVKDFLVLPQGFRNFPSVFFCSRSNWIVGSSINILTDLILFHYQTAIKYTINFSY